MDRAVDVFAWTSAKALTPFPTAFPWTNWQDTHWMSGLKDGYKIIKQVALRELSIQCFSLRLTDCHKWGALGIDTGPQGVQHLHRWPRWWHLNLFRFADSIKLADQLNTSWGRALLQIDLDRLEGRARKTSVKFDKDKYQVLHLGWNTQKAQCRLSHVLPAGEQPCWKWPGSPGGQQQPEYKSVVQQQQRRIRP